MDDGTPLPQEQGRIGAREALINYFRVAPGTECLENKARW